MISCVQALFTLEKNCTCNNELIDNKFYPGKKQQGEGMPAMVLSAVCTGCDVYIYELI